MIVDGGIRLIKIWLEVGQEEQDRRFEARIDDPMRQWKLSPMDVESYARWYDYSRARDLMFEATDTEHAPWHIVRSDDKKRARLNGIAHILSQIPYKKVAHAKVKLPKPGRTRRSTTIRRRSPAAAWRSNGTELRLDAARAGEAMRLREILPIAEWPAVTR